VIKPLTADRRARGISSETAVAAAGCKGALTIAHQSADGDERAKASAADGAQNPTQPVSNHEHGRTKADDLQRKARSAAIDQPTPGNHEHGCRSIKTPNRLCPSWPRNADTVP